MFVCVMDAHTYVVAFLAHIRVAGARGVAALRSELRVVGAGGQRAGCECRICHKRETVAHQLYLGALEK